MRKDLSYFIDKVVALESFWNVNYYMRCMKKAPHGGIEYAMIPNYYLKYKSVGSWNLFTKFNGDIPYIFRKLIDDEMKIWSECNVDIEELLMLCFDGDFWYAGFRVLKTKENNSHDAITLWNVVENNLRFSDYFNLDNLEEILYAFTCYLIQENMIIIDGLDNIKQHELLQRKHNKYGLSDVTFANFHRQGFECNGIYYLYNIFLDTSIGKPFSTMPLTIEIIKTLPDIKIEMRCDEILAVPSSEKIETATWDSQKFRGIKLVWSKIDKLVYGSQTVVHGDPENLNKLLLTITKDQEEGEVFFHIAIEELWNPESIQKEDDIVVVNFIHAKYFSNRKAFTHIDFSVNQYQKEVYKLKHSDATNDKSISINQYSDIHYKIWCIEGTTIPVESWSSLVCATLDLPFRKLFYEMFPDDD